MESRDCGTSNAYPYSPLRSESRASASAFQTRVAHVILSLRPGGAERFLCNLTASRGEGFAPPLVVCLDDTGELAGLIERSGGQVRLLKRGSGFDPHLVLRMARLFREERITAVHTHSLDAMLYGGLAARLAGVPARIHTQHNTMLASGSARDRCKFRIGSRLFTHLVAVSEQARAGMLSAGAPALRCLTILNGVDVPVRPVRNASGAVLGTVARLAPEKGIDRLIRAFARISAEYPRLRLRIIGDGPLRASLESLARELSVASRVEFLGFVSDVPQALAALDIFALPSLTEGIPLALLEAMAAGLPVVASNVGGIPEVITDGQSGILVPPGDIDALAEALYWPIADSGLREKLGAAAHARVGTTFSLPVMTRRYESLYRSDPPIRLRRALRRLLHCAPRRLVFSRADSPRAAITFDDGPDPDYTPRILDLLHRADVKATFFLIGERAAREPHIVRRIRAEGHEIANHSYTHTEFSKLSFSAVRTEIEHAEQALSAAGAPPCPYLRPPKGYLSLSSILACWFARKTIVLWSADFKDFRASTAAQILETAREHPIAPGDILLYHGNTDASLEALPDLLEAAARRNLRLVTVSELVGAKPHRGAKSARLAPAS